ncbi:MAG: hypothetical protein ACR2QS_06765 [Woeseiaceae bacterium]
MTVLRAITFIACLFFASVVSADDDALPFGNTEACMEGPMAQFGQYIGDWKIEDSTLAQDGSGWTDGQGARWVFACFGNGTAIQDFWYPANGAIGTNLRTYNPETGTWEIAWTVDKLPGFTHIRAKQVEDGSIVMDFVAPIPNPLRRITFFPVDETGWKWTLELSNDEGENWMEVYRINATPYAEVD